MSWETIKDGVYCHQSALSFYSSGYSTHVKQASPTFASSLPVQIGAVLSLRPLSNERNLCSNHEIRMLFEHGFYLKILKTGLRLFAWRYVAKLCGPEWAFCLCFCRRQHYVLRLMFSKIIIKSKPRIMAQLRPKVEVPIKILVKMAHDKKFLSILSSRNNVSDCNNL